MVYNYLVLDSLDKWPKEKKVLLLQLLDIKDGSKKSIESIVVDTDYLMEVEKRLNTAIKQTNSIESVIDMNGLTKENKAKSPIYGCVLKKSSFSCSLIKKYVYLCRIKLY